jgi:glycosyltransferase involved in cell wall biosynthesis
MTTATSVVIRCFNEEKHIGRLLTGVLQQTQPPGQIVVVDSGSTDATVSIASRFPVEVQRVEPELFSFGRSLNVGCQAARGDVVVVASAHVYPLFDTWLEELTSPFDDPQVALAYGRQEGSEDTKYSERRVMARWYPAQSIAHQDHPFANNANAAIRRSIWKEQPYDEELTGLEDLAWAKRAMERGYAIAYVATAPVVHAHDETWAQVVNRYRREAIAHRRIYRDQEMSAFEAMRLAAVNIASDYVHALRDGVLLGNLLSIPAFRTAQFLGTQKGFAQRGETPAVLRRHFYYPHGWRRQPGASIPSRARPIMYEDPEKEEADASSD